MAETAPSSQPIPTPTTVHAPVTLPRLTITYCTQCRWLLRAAWLQQELLSTFSTTLGEVALVPATGGVFRIHLLYLPAQQQEEEGRGNEGAREVLLWDRKAEGGFPEAKVLKQRVRDCVEPGRGLGHSDVGGKKAEKGGGEGGLVDGKEGKEGTAPDLAGSVRETGPRNPLVARMRPGGGEKGAGAEGKGEAKGGEDCEDCK